MKPETKIKQIIKTLQQLPPNRVEEVANFVGYVLKKHNNQILNNGIEKMAEQSVVFQFLHDEEDLYTLQDIKEKY